MPLKRTSTKYRKGMTKRRSYRKKSSNRPIAVLARMKRTFHWQTWTPATTTTGDFWKFLNPRFVDMPSSNELISVFDQYKVSGVKLTFRPRHTGFDGANTTDTTAPGVTNQGTTNMHIIIDPTSYTTPSGTYTSANLNQFLENGNVRTYSGIKPFSIYYKPRTNTATGSGPSKAANQWLSCTSASDLALNGVHAFAQDVNLTGVFGQAFDIFVTYYMSFRGMR